VDLDDVSEGSPMVPFVEQLIDTVSTVIDVLSPFLK